MAFQEVNQGRCTLTLVDEKKNSTCLPVTDIHFLIFFITDLLQTFVMGSSTFLNRKTFPQATTVPLQRDNFTDHQLMSGEIAGSLMISRVACEFTLRTRQVIPSTFKAIPFS